MTIRDIIVEHLRTNGFDGLWNADLECGCALDDLIPCMFDCTADCIAGYRIPCTCIENGVSDTDCGCHMGPKPSE